VNTFEFLENSMEQFHGTTIISVRRQT